MIKQIFKIEKYWKVIVYYNIDYSFFDDIYFELRLLNFSKESIDDIFNKIKSGNVKAATCNSIEERVSVVLFGNHSSDIDYINSIVHEAEHVKQALLRAYSVDDIGENAAYTIGYIVSRMYSIFKNIKK
jgi:hypothetical protein